MFSVPGRIYKPCPLIALELFAKFIGFVGVSTFSLIISTAVGTCI